MAGQTDVRIENHGSIILFRPMTEAVEEWLRDNTDGMWFCGALAVEARYAETLADGLMADGFEVAQ